MPSAGSSGTSRLHLKVIAPSEHSGDFLLDAMLLLEFNRLLYLVGLFPRGSPYYRAHALLDNRYAIPSLHF